MLSGEPHCRVVTVVEETRYLQTGIIEKGDDRFEIIQDFAFNYENGFLEEMFHFLKILFICGSCFSAVVCNSDNIT